jgi:predicted metalloprotease
MKWESGRRSSNVDDRRGRGGGGRPVALGGGVTLVIIIGALLLGVDPRAVLGALEQGGAGRAPASGAGPAAGAPRSPEEDRLADFVTVVLGDTEDTWPALLQGQGVRYQPPRLVLFTDAVQSACGSQSSAVGPFYCPGDQQVYIDLTFFGELDRRFGAPGDFAQAYVVAHEVGHHVQHLLGVSDRVHAERRQLPEAQANQLSVRQELQADCFAGVWAHHAQRQRQVLEPGDVEEGLQAATAIGDDTLQKRARGRAVPESFTHGSAAQRVRWFQKGFQEGTVQGCDTFAVAQP